VHPQAIGREADSLGLRIILFSSKILSKNMKNLISLIRFMLESYLIGNIAPAAAPSEGGRIAFFAKG
jgi:hypothetical protein